MTISKNSKYYHVADELANKVRHLHTALGHAEDIISKLEAENQRLKDVLTGLASENNGDYVLDSEAFNEPVCSA